MTDDEFDALSDAEGSARLAERIAERIATNRAAIDGIAERHSEWEARERRRAFQVIDGGAS